MDETLPNWLWFAKRNTNVAERERLTPLLRSWMRLSPLLPRMSESDLLKLVLLECQGQRRPVIISRCLSRFRSKRQARENAEVFELAGATMPKRGRRA